MRVLYRTMQMAIAALRRNVMRSALTTLGIVIGVGAVIAMVEIGEGASREIEAAIASMGSNTILVLPGNLAAAGVSDVVEVVRAAAPEVAWDEPIAFLLVDGLHDYANVARDFQKFAPHLVDGGYVAFHDYAGYYPRVGTSFSGLPGRP